MTLNHVLKHLFVEKWKINSIFARPKKKGGRVVEGARLESVYTAMYRGFESLPFCIKKSLVK